MELLPKYKPLEGKDYVCILRSFLYLPIVYEAIPSTQKYTIGGRLMLKKNKQHIIRQENVISSRHSIVEKLVPGNRNGKISIEGIAIDLI